MPIVVFSLKPHIQIDLFLLNLSLVPKCSLIIDEYLPHVLVNDDGVTVNRSLALTVHLKS